ncbi:2-methylaconitate cis-trans isomerase PrpF [Variovorax sp. J22G21]|uniref:2-methylaconitate cis-trans isomerase PrpF n=1 Tax=Variovorax fucosicus TaxID=3053517 RepID=UPI0025789598|nr:MULTISPECIES: 2-methylaconitate cis-trans isomerase PrpF [unclassified Variovorax]MDM0040165.1 2-methylaconitate cis-trans isomerase PrpF [Variovorax sp. J22R193]MDM0061538.1 2-methylaconitate cis-trans isomerase PrpF [Variovorax sp. J22G21]
MSQSPPQIAVRATYMRGGTSKGVFFALDDLPAAARVPGAARDALLLRVTGSPDPYGKQIDGMGGATSSTSKVVLVGKSTRPDCDVDYLFGAVAIESAVVDWSGNCGNLTSAVGPFAITRGLMETPANGMAVVRIWQANIGKRIIAHVPVRGGQVVELGDFELDGVAFPSAEIKLEFLDPGAGEDSEGGAMFPTGNRTDHVEVPGLGRVETTLINAGNPTIFVDAAAIGLKGTEMQGDVNSDAALLKRLEDIRAHATVAMGLASSADEATAKRPHTPKIAFVSKPTSYTSSSGKEVDGGAIDLTARIMSMGKLHHAMTGTGAVAIAVAAAIPGTLVSRLLANGSSGTVRFGHPSGSLFVGAEAAETRGEWGVTKAIMSRSARRIMDGQVFVPSV